MVEKMARLLYPEGREIGNWDRRDQAFADTKRALNEGNCTVFEATIIHANMLARVDILQRFGKTLRLIEVKSSSADSDGDEDTPFRGKRGGITSKWRPYLEDVTYQAMVLRRAFPDFEVIPYLCVADKARRATVNSTFDKFTLVRGEEPLGRFRPNVEYTGDAARLADEHVLAIFNVSEFVAELEAEVATAAEQFAATIGETVERIAPIIGKHCKKCEYRVTADVSPNGFKECWGARADPNPHLLDLYHMHLLGGKNSDSVATLAASTACRLSDVPMDWLTGAAGERQKVQLECTAANREFIDPQLKRILSGHKYPLHFIDFEASRLALPYHIGMSPYEIAAFQWSVHSLSGSDAVVEHAEWLNDAAFPNFEFARSLMRHIGDHGTVYIWSPYERTVLREVRRQMDAYREKDPKLAAWPGRFIADGNPRVVDLCELTKRYYFHPMMKDRVSIKYVLPAVWDADEALRADPAFAQYVGHEGSGKLLNPYDTLLPLPIGTKEEVVNEGTAAMRTYQEAMFGLGAGDPSTRENYRKLLLQYCKLDTAAMVMIWRHWRNA